MEAPLVIEFVPGTRVEREALHVAHLPIVGNGPPGTTVSFPGGTRVPLPTDQIVGVDDAVGGDQGARVGFGGMSFAGVVDGRLLFLRVRDLAPEAELSPERRPRMTLELHMVVAVIEHGQLVWPSLH
jgi:hypothetical protein